MQTAPAHWNWMHRFFVAGVKAHVEAGTFQPLDPHLRKRLDELACEWQEADPHADLDFVAVALAGG